MLILTASVLLTSQSKDRNPDIMCESLMQGDEGFGEDGPTSGGPAHGGGSSLVCSLRGKSTFPSVVVSDMRLQNGGLGSSTVQLWRQFNLLTLNKVLQSLLHPIGPPSFGE